MAASTAITTPAITSRAATSTSAPQRSALPPAAGGRASTTLSSGRLAAAAGRGRCASRSDSSRSRAWSSRRSCVSQRTQPRRWDVEAGAARRRQRAVEAVGDQPLRPLAPAAGGQRLERAPQRLSPRRECLGQDGRLERELARGVHAGATGEVHERQGVTLPRAQVREPLRDVRERIRRLHRVERANGHRPQRRSLHRRSSITDDASRPAGFPPTLRGPRGSCRPARVSVGSARAASPAGLYYGILTEFPEFPPRR